MTSQSTIGFFFVSRNIILPLTHLYDRGKYVYVKERKGSRDYNIIIYHYHNNNES